MTHRRTWHELVSEREDAIALVARWVREAPFPVEILGCDPLDGRRALEVLQVTTRSPMGALALHTGGLLIDRGWLRVLGAGCPRLPRALDEWNGLARDPRRLSQGLLVADDALGGFFAWFNEPRTIHYLSPDTFAWEDLGLGYTDWLAAMLTDHLQKFYETLRWPGWSDEVELLDGASALHVAPPLMMVGPAIGDRSRKAVSVDELWHMALDLERQLRDLPDGAKVRIVIEE